MQSSRENPDSVENAIATRNNQREIFALQMQEKKRLEELNEKPSDDGA